MAEPVEGAEDRDTSRQAWVDEKSTDIGTAYHVTSKSGNFPRDLSLDVKRKGSTFNLYTGKRENMRTATKFSKYSTT
jgi:hypothetical protein